MTPGERVAAVTGASGLLGSALVPRLLEGGWRVRVLVHRRRPAHDGALEVVTGDVRDEAAVRRLVRGADAVFHLAARISISGDEDGSVLAVNAVGTEVVCRACLAQDCGRLVHVSSVHAFVQAPGATVTEDTPLVGPCDAAPAYDQSKAQGVRIVEHHVRHGLDAVVVHPSAIAGPGDAAPSRVGRVLLAMARGRMPVVLRGGYDWVDARDVAQGLVAAWERGERGGRYLLTGHHASFVEIARIAAEWAGRAARVWALPAPLLAPVAPLAEAWGAVTGREALFTPEALRAAGCGVRFDCRRARDALGWSPRPLGETIRDALDWFATAGMLSPPRRAREAA